MRLWHQHLVPFLSDQRLLGQHRECCALRGKGWGKKHDTVNYVFEHPYGLLYRYHKIVMDEISRRGFKVDTKWHDSSYRGKILGFDTTPFTSEYESIVYTIYPEHDDGYYKLCTRLLAERGDGKLKRTRLLDQSCGAGELIPEGVYENSRKRKN